MKKVLLILMMAFSCFSSICAQWNNDYSKNNQITPSSLSFDNHEVATNDDGVTFIFYMVPNNIAYSMRLQIIDKDGNKVFGSGGKEISKEPNLTWTKVNRHLMIDHDGNAIIGVQDCRLDTTLTTSSYTIYKYSPDGQKLWQTILGDSISRVLQACLSMCCSDDGGYVFASEYGLDTLYTEVEKLDKDGKQVWNKPVEIIDEGTTAVNGAFPYPFLVDAGNSRTMLIYVNSENEDLKARMINADGSSAWEKDIMAYSGTYSSSKIWQVIDLYPGPDGGAVLAIMNKDLYGLIDYIKSDGTLPFATGTSGTTVNDNSYSSLKPSVYYSKQDSAIYCVYQQFNANNQKKQGLYMQKFSSAGEREWGNDGKAIIAMQQGKQYSYYSLQDAGNGHIAVFYQERDDSTKIVNSYVTVYDKDGNVVEKPKSFSTSAYQKEQLGSSQMIDGKYFIANWCETRTTGGNLCLYMQKVNLDTPVTAVQSASMSPAESLAKKEIFSPTGIRIQGYRKGLNIVRYTYTDNSVKVEKVIK